ncbi:agamous-like MADS-box protein AGL12 [Populus alba]|uniref:Agamous-like MADS-box protein AGL12 n=3 Tax=Populus TaxID=3689 RepID=A0A4U5QAJ6_POPAL|nr:agamous-like MADS-box protein AGL12 [Populus alba]KAJ6952426.1 agamous-like MADS-box protein AGL12 [Populus alba x Populus x berolinensis]TKS06961.1 agamous-like MADS-box protein AGL12 [Populus alba]
MARGKVQLKRIENHVHRQVTFCKRRAGLLKKAKELSVLCDAEIGVFIFSSHGKLYELATKGTMQGLIERYMKSSRGAQPEPAAMETQPAPDPDTKEEISMLKQEIEELQKGLRYMFGARATTEMSLDELLVLEKHLEIWIYQIRSTKMDIMIKEIQQLRNKEEMLTAANQHLHNKVEENAEITNFVSVTTDFPHPLTTQNEIIFQY